MSDTNKFILRLHREELQTAKWLLKKFKDTPAFIDTDLIKIQLGEGNLGDNEFNILEYGVELYIQWKEYCIKKDLKESK